MSQSSEMIRILVVDDEPARFTAIVESVRGLAQITARTPFEVVDEDLAGVDLVSVDEYLGEEWALRAEVVGEELPASRKNIDGLAVAASFRSLTRQSVRESGLNFAVTLHTAELEKLSLGLPARSREALTAAQHDLDWVFNFDERLGVRFVEIARAVQSAGASANTMGNDFGASWLDLPTAAWSQTSREQIEDCRPPAHALAQSTNGRSYLRWLAQRVLPYPTFLLDDHHAAHLLGISLDSLTALEMTLRDKATEIRYAGPLSDFVGPRWWRAGWQQVLVDAGANQWDSSEVKARALSRALSVDVTPLSNAQPVVTYDLDGNLLSIDESAEEAVRLQADGWPIYADDPWSLIEDVLEDSDLKRLVAQSDRARLADTA